MARKWTNPEERREYNRNHYRIAKALGRAAEYHCQHCDGDAHEWAQIKGCDGSDPHEHFLSLCRKCHRRYDDKWDEEERAKVSRTMKERAKTHKPFNHTGAKRSDETKTKMSESQKEWYRQNGPRTGWTHTEDAKRRISESNIRTAEAKKAGDVK